MMFKPGAFVKSLDERLTVATDYATNTTLITAIWILFAGAALGAATQQDPIVMFTTALILMIQISGAALILVARLLWYLGGWGVEVLRERVAHAKA